MKKNRLHKIAIIGGGPAGCFCAYNLQKHFDVTIFEQNKPLFTLLPTGGGRCNLAHNEFDINNLAHNYPRGEKFLYSIFSRFATKETLNFFHKIGIQTYTQNDNRIFPKSNNSQDVREKILTSLNLTKFKNEKVIDIKTQPLTVVTDKNFYTFDDIVIAIGGHSKYSILNALGHNIISPKPALTALKTRENFSSLKGISLQNVRYKKLIGDILFTHNGISGPLIYKISSIKARDVFPYEISLDLIENINLQEKFEENPHKTIKNILSEFLPKTFAEFVLDLCNIDAQLKAYTINKKIRNNILEKLHNFKINITAPTKGNEVVTCGGVDLKEINSKTLESKLIPSIYFCGEVMDIDGFCGGFNLQNCWSTAYCVAESIIEKYKQSL